MNVDITLNLFKDIQVGSNCTSNEVELAPGGKLFGKLLAKEIREGKQDACDGVAKKGAKANREELEETMSRLGAVAGLNLAVPSTCRQILVGVLKAFGLSKAECAWVLSKSTDNNGFIQLNKLWRHVRGILAEKGKETTGLGIGKDHMAELTVLLLRLGVSPEKMKEALEKHAMSKVELQLKDITAMLNDLAPGLGLNDQDTKAILRYLNIPLHPLDVASLTKDSNARREVSKELAAIRANISTSQPRLFLKRALAQALREKGLPPEKVRQILEGLNVEQIREKLEHTEQNGAMAREIESLLDALQIEKTPRSRVVISKKSVDTKILDEGRGRAQDVQAALSKKDDVPLRPETEKVVELLKAIKGAGLKAKDKQSVNQLEKGGEVKNHVVMVAGERSSSSPEMARWNRTQAIDAHIQHNIQKMAEHLKWMLTVGRQESRLTLHPPELGQMDLRVVIRQGHLQVQLSTEHPWAKEIVDASLNNLRHQLTHAGFAVDKLEVTVGLGGGGLEAHSGDGDRTNRFSLSKPNVSNQVFEVDEVTTPSITFTLQKDHTFSIVV